MGTARTGRDWDSFAALLREYRCEYRGAANLTQEQLAERAGLSVQAVSLLERGVRRAPRSATVQALADGLRLDAERRRALAAAAQQRPPDPGNAQPPPDAMGRKRHSSAPPAPAAPARGSGA